MGIEVSPQLMPRLVGDKLVQVTHLCAGLFQEEYFQFRQEYSEHSF